LFLQQQQRLRLQLRQPALCSPQLNAGAAAPPAAYQVRYRDEEAFRRKLARMAKAGPAALKLVAGDGSSRSNDFSP